MIVQRRVAFSETDASGRVHFTSMLKWAEDAEHQFLREKEVAVFSATAGWPRVNVSCDYKRALAVDELVSVEIQLAEIRNSSLVWSFQVFNESGEQAAVGQFVTVCMIDGRKAEIDDEMRGRLESR